jgi:hypothetical protein
MRSPTAAEKSERMSYWRWLLFAAMARFEVGEDVYWGIPNAKTIRREVPVESYLDRESDNPPGSCGQGGRVALDGRSAAMRFVAWLGGLGGRRSPH